MAGERLQKYEIPYVPFPKNPQKVTMLDFEVFKYVEGSEMKKFIKQLSDRNSLRDYDEVLVNWRGGWELFVALARLQNYPRWPSICEIHRSDFGTYITKPVDNFLRRKKVLVVDDIFDRGLTMIEALRYVGPESRGVTAVWKDGVDGQVFDPRVDSAVRVDNKWMGGMGMNMGLPGERELFRRQPGLYVKP